jgi:uncharacterized protein
MNHLESSFSGKNSFWRYLVMVVAVFLASNTIGGIPLIISFLSNALNNPEVAGKLAANPNDLSALGVDPNYGLFMMLFPFIAGLAAFVLLVKPLNSRTFMQVINGGRPFRWNRFLISAFLWAAVSFIYLIVYLRMDPENFTRNPDTSKLAILIVVSLLFIPFQAAFEEVLFRGYLMQGVSLIIRNRFFPLIMTSVLFGLMHAMNPEVKEFGFWTMIPQYILFGLIFGIITILDDGIESAIGAHAANNIFLCIMVTNESSALQTPALYEQHTIYPWIEFGAMILIGAGIIFLMKAIFKWGSFSLLLDKIIPEKREKSGFIN